MRNSERIVGFLILLIGVFILVKSLEFDYMVEGTPGPGFIPLWTGLILSLLALYPIFHSFEKDKTEKHSIFKSSDFKPVFVFIGGGILVMLVTPITGLMIPMGLMVGVNTKLMGTKSWKTIISLTVLTPVFMYLLFEKFLGVPFPKGFLGI